MLRFSLKPLGEHCDSLPLPAQMSVRAELVGHAPLRPLTSRGIGAADCPLDMRHDSHDAETARQSDQTE